MINKTYSFELTERDIKDIAETKAGRRTVMKLRYLILSFAILIPLSIIPTKIYDLDFLPFLGGFTALLISLYILMVVIHRKYTNEYVEELMNRENNGWTTKNK